MKTERVRLRATSVVVRATAAMFVALLAVTSAYAGTATTVSSTIPGNGDLNPYGVAVVPMTTGSLVKGISLSVISTTAAISRAQAQQSYRSRRVETSACLPKSIQPNCPGRVPAESD
jgi:hypothetical protein